MMIGPNTNNPGAVDPTKQPATVSTTTAQVTVPATIGSTHEMIVALIIFAATGMGLVIASGSSPKAGNFIAGVLAIMILIQGITHVNPLVEFLAAHPLTPPANVGSAISTGIAQGINQSKS